MGAQVTQSPPRSREFSYTLGVQQSPFLSAQVHYLRLPSPTDDSETASVPLDQDGPEPRAAARSAMFSLVLTALASGFLMTWIVLSGGGLGPSPLGIPPVIALIGALAGYGTSGIGCVLATLHVRRVQRLEGDALVHGRRLWCAVVLLVLNTLGIFGPVGVLITGLLLLGVRAGLGSLGLVVPQGFMDGAVFIGLAIGLVTPPVISFFLALSALRPLLRPPDPVARPST